MRSTELAKEAGENLLTSKNLKDSTELIDVLSSSMLLFLDFFLSCSICCCREDSGDGIFKLLTLDESSRDQDEE